MKIAKYKSKSCSRGINVASSSHSELYRISMMEQSKIGENSIDNIE